MRWVVSCTPDTRALTEKLFQGAVALDYFSISDDDRSSSHALNTAISESQTVTFSEEIVLGCGPNACQILNAPLSPVRMILSSYFKKVPTTVSTKHTSNVGNSNRLVTMSISSFQNETLARGGTPLALKVAQGLGIVTDEKQAAVESQIASLKFGARKTSGHLVQIKSPFEADSIINSLFKSLSFQRHLPGMSLCVRLSFAIYSDAPDDGDDFPHWVNEQIVTLWFVNDRHIEEFLSTFERSVKSGFPTRMILGYAKISSFESAARCADTAAHAWQIVNSNGTFLPLSISGRPVGPNQLLHQPQLGGVNASVFSPFTNDLQSTHNFVVQQRKRLLEETAAYLNTARTSSGQAESLQASREELEQLGHIYDESEKKFTEVAQQLEIERERFRATEDEVKTIADDIEKGQKHLNEQEERRKELVAKIAALTKTRNDLKAKAEELKDLQTASKRHREVENAKYQNALIAEAVQRQEEIDEYRKMLQNEASVERKKLADTITTLRARLEQTKMNSGHSDRVQVECLEKQNELDFLRQKQKKLTVDQQDIETQLSTLRTQILSLQAEQFHLTKANLTPEEFDASVTATKVQLKREQSELAETKSYLATLEERKSKVLAKQMEIEEASRVQIEESKALQLQFSEEAKCLIDEELDALQTHQDFVRQRIISEFENQLHAFNIDFWIHYNQIRITIRLKNAEIEREKVIEKVNDVKGEISSLSYQALQLDGDIEQLSAEVKEATTAKDELKANIHHSLEEIRAEKRKLLEALAGNGTNAFPLLDAQREVLEQRFSLLQRCISLPSLEMKTDIETTTNTVSPILTRQIIESDLNEVVQQLEKQLSVIKVDNSYIIKNSQSLKEKRQHLLEEEQIRTDILAHLTSSDNELGRIISALKDEIQQMRREATNLQSNQSRITHENSVLNDEKKQHLFDEERKILRRIQEAESKLHNLETHRAENYRKLKINQARLESLKRKQSDVWKVSKDILQLTKTKKEMLEKL